MESLVGILSEPLSLFDSIYVVDPSQEYLVACSGRCLVLEAEFRSI
jgi:hypothetical protein